MTKEDEKSQLSLINLVYDLFDSETNNSANIIKSKPNYDSIETLLNSVHERLIDNIYCERGAIYAFDIIDENNDRNIRSVNLDLYDGLAGYAMYLLYYGIVRKDLKSIKLSEQICFECYNRIKLFKEIEIGAFKGISGILYVISHVYSYTKTPELLDLAEKIIRVVNIKIKRDDKKIHFDIIFGISGSILSLASVYKVNKSKQVYNCIKKLAKLLVSRVVRDKNGIGWKFYTKNPLTGYSHGNSGSIHALFKAYEITKITQFKDIAIEALEYERNNFDTTEANWKDLRFEDGNNRNGYNWCNGAMGIGLQRIELKKYFTDGYIDNEIKTALNSTLKFGFGMNNCLCHGNFGNIELPLTYSLSNDNELKIKESMKKLKTYLFNYILKNGIVCSHGSIFPSLSFMTGEIGVLYQILRLDFPSVVPNILLLEEPK